MMRRRYGGGTEGDTRAVRGSTAVSPPAHAPEREVVLRLAHRRYKRPYRGVVVVVSPGNTAVPPL